ncbi:DNA polymerase [Taphrina deformans PYCC 5710]|uniref:DNA polymerase epsilon catalytic subunit n=1 Tax=Taphrina deformans (strain PYCC 5710 / ATCC 11124 / CBS 356.35 / IMI 108563 / JCM 9778 / NBRC 8474) TaxID=1097556 RepID=R4X9Y3_TAPDE|nr:DNA polymerase [Taphrina deformans PYCC 5710]|eukprot:CCG82582.1 DNA polymerase [Taphrina deformans PYCC 5710]
MGRPSRTFGIPGTAQRGKGRGTFVKRADANTPGVSDTTTANSAEDRYVEGNIATQIDEKFGFAKFEAGPTKQGWLINMHSTLLEDSDYPTGRAAVDFYFLEDNGGSFKATIPFEPYFYIAAKVNHEAEVEEFVRRKFELQIRGLSRSTKEDLKMPNHLTGYRRTFIKLSFANTNDLFEVKRFLGPIVEKNKADMDAFDVYNEVAAEQFNQDDAEIAIAKQDPTQAIIDLREYDVPYQVRVAIDKDIRIGKWYNVHAKHGHISLNVVEERITRADPVIMAFDIETTKLPLKFPDAAVDQIMMISYMIDGEGYLITNREIVSRDIDDFEYTPKPEFKGPFIIFNESDEKAVLERFFSHMQDAKPTVVVTYNGDFFDWPFVETRASIHGIDMFQEIGFKKNSEDVYESRYCAHMDAFAWVKRDSYLPQGSQGLKAVTTAKLGYDPIELDPELMLPYAVEKPQLLAQYSVSDAVATYYLYMKYCHPFIFSLCNIIPLNPDDVLRKGTGTLCEMLLMVKAYQDRIILPNKYVEEPERFFEGHLLESETYVGGHVESLEAGVFRSDIPEKFEIQSEAIQKLINDLDHALRFSIEVEAGKSLADVEDYDVIRAEILAKLENLRDHPNRSDCPKIYHLDVASMYPNIMTTNRLQPDSMIDEADCATCDFNRPGKTCDKKMTWSWRGEYYPVTKGDYNMLKNTLASESVAPKFSGGRPRNFHDLSPAEQMTLVKSRVSDYSKKVYHKLKETRTIERETIVCQRENPFYVNTVKSFRDRRYEYKGHQKTWKRNAEQLSSSGASALEVDEAKKMVVLYDSLQLAHKVILNSFYGYVMRKGSRWYSMEMAGVTCLTGATIIQLARQLVEKIGRPLELDTDGIWCILPATFPENFAFRLKNGKSLFISYPCVMLNHLVHDKFTNHQYEDLVNDKSFKYSKHSENSIFFEVDGPYRAMILPTSKEENKNLKKRYAVFNDDGTLAELKGFEVKRRGELKLIKVFQTQVFKVFLEGNDLEECYAAVAKVANKWLDVLYSKGSTLADEELVELVCENRSMSKTIAEYGSLKSTSISTAKRLAEFLGDQMIKDKGLACKYIISAQPRGSPVTERAIPIAIFSSEESIKRHFLRKWLKDPGCIHFDLRSIIDWEYYLDRFGSVIQKLITMPAAMQKIANPVPRIAHPDWLNKQLAAALNPYKQAKMTSFFKQGDKQVKALQPNVDSNLLNRMIPDLEDSLKSVQYNRKGIMSHKRKDRSSNAQLAQQPEVIKSLPLNDFEGVVMTPSGKEKCGYTQWLRHQKQRWRLQAETRARRKQIMGLEDELGPPKHIGALDKLQVRATARVTGDNYEVLQLQETDQPGILKAWVMIGNGLSSIKVKVARSFYVNFRGSDMPEVEIKDCKLEKVSAKLPNGQNSSNMFLLTMSEDVYLTSQHELASVVSHPSVEGIYEKDIAMLDRALMGMGTVCAFTETRPGALGEAMSSGFDLDSLKSSTALKNNYLSTSSLQYIFVLQTSAGQREAISVFSSAKASCSTVMYDESSKEAAQGNSHSERIYRETRARMDSTTSGSALFEYPTELECSTVTVNTETRFYKAVNEAIRNMKADRSGPLAIILSSPGVNELQKRLPICGEHPIMCMPTADTLSNSLNWQSIVMKTLVAKFLTIRSWLEYRIMLSRYGQVPICNLGDDEAKTVIDLTMARRLRSEDVVLWWSGAPQPDQGGREQDDLVKALETVEPVKMNNPGAYNTVCIELEVRNIIISTILNSALINELEGSAAADSFTTGAADEGDMQDKEFLSPSISSFKSLVKAWWHEASVGTREADIMIDNAVRWMQSQDSALYDKNLDIYSQRITNKAFLQLMAEFRKVGSKVVFGAPGRILIQTSKNHIGTAYAYGQYIIKAIRSKPLFHFIDVQIVEYWDYLMWLDEVNFGGYCCKEILASDEQEMSIAMQWNLKNYLPQILSDIFEDWVVEFMGDMYDVKKELSEFSATQKVVEDVEANTTERKMSAVVQQLGAALTKQVQQLAIRYNKWSLESPEGDNTFLARPQPGSHLPKENPVLSLVKYLSTVFALVGESQVASRVLRRDLLAVLDVKEFSNAGKFEDPCQALILPRFCCSHCSDVRDLQFCRDHALAPKPTSSGHGVEFDWQCPRCGTDYNRLAIQEQLLQSLLALLASYQLQDLRCGKCKKVKTTNMRDHCECSGKWVTTIKKTDVLEKIKVMKNVSKFYELEMLSGAIQELAVA